MAPRTRRRLQLLGLLSALVVTAAAAAAMLDTARPVEVIGLAGGAFGAGASVVSLVVERRKGIVTPAARDGGANTAAGA